MTKGATSLTGLPEHSIGLPAHHKMCVCVCVQTEMGSGALSGLAFCMTVRVGLVAMYGIVVLKVLVQIIPLILEMMVHGCLSQEQGFGARRSLQAIRTYLRTYVRA